MSCYQLIIPIKKSFHFIFIFFKKKKRKKRRKRKLLDVTVKPRHITMVGNRGRCDAVVRGQVHFVFLCLKINGPNTSKLFALLDVFTCISCL